MARAYPPRGRARSDGNDTTVTEAITRVVSVMGIQVVAEYVESIEIFYKLREIGVNYAQGYGVSEPIWLSEKSNVSSLADTRLRKLQCA